MRQNYQNLQVGQSYRLLPIIIRNAVDELIGDYLTQGDNGHPMFTPGTCEGCGRGPLPLVGQNNVCLTCEVACLTEWEARGNYTSDAVFQYADTYPKLTNAPRLRNAVFAYWREAFVTAVLAATATATTNDTKGETSNVETSR